MISVIVGLAIVVAVHFIIALLIERFALRSKEGQTRIFLACFVAIPIVLGIWLYFYTMFTSYGWQMAIGITLVGYGVSLIPAALRWWIVRRRAAKNNVQSADIFQ